MNINLLGVVCTYTPASMSERILVSLARLFYPPFLCPLLEK